uniref:Mitochondrial import inner membrane translocase subunit n=1 Tax=Ditylenchus dipsaci TaxID=166011 RepID=A0A915E0U7_9BILA
MVTRRRVTKARFIQQVQAESQRVKSLLRCLLDTFSPSEQDGCQNTTCLVNCVNTMIDASAFMVEHLQKIEQKHV